MVERPWFTSTVVFYCVDHFILLKLTWLEGEVWGVLGGNEGTGRGRTHGGSGGVGTGTNFLCFFALQADF